MNILIIILTNIILWSLVFIFPIPYMLSVIFSNILNIISNVGESIRMHKMGYAVKRTEEGSLMNTMLLFVSIAPLINIIFSSINYFRTFKKDENEFIKLSFNEPIKYKEAIKDKELPKEEYKLSNNMLQIEELVDEISLNTNLSNKQKEELLKELRTKLLFKQKIKSKKIKKLIK